MYKHRVVALSSLIFCIGIANAECINTITNKSQSPWKIRLTAYKKPIPPVGSDIGSVQQGYVFTINPAEMLQMNLNSIGSGDIILTDNNNESFTFSYTVYSKITCPYIHHYQRTGAVTLNDLKNGDVIIEQDAWADVKPDTFIQPILPAGMY